MLRRRVRFVVLLGVLAFPSCIVVTCGETHTFRTRTSESTDTVISGATTTDTAAEGW